MKKRMTLLDSGFIRMERHESPQHGTILIIFQEPAGSPPDYMQRLAAHMRGFPVTRTRFNWRLSKSLTDKAVPAWDVLAPDDIDLDYHFRHSALPRPGSELELALVVSRLATHPIDLSRPPWEVHLIEGLQEDRFALFVKVHHSLVDGMTVLKILRSWLSEDPTQTDAAPLWVSAPALKSKAPQRKRGKEDETSLLRKVVGAAQGAVDVAVGVGESAVSIGGAVAKTVAAGFGSGDGLVAPYSPPRTLFNDRITQRRRISTQRVELARLRSIARRIDGTLNDAIATVFGGAVRRYLIEHDALPDRTLVGGVLASLRATVDEAASEDAGNVISFIFADLATDIDDIDERAKRVVRSTRAGKDHLLGLNKDAMNYSSLMLLPFLATTLTGTGHLLPAFNVGLSNVPGVDVPMYWNGALAEALHATTIITNGQALVVTVTSWNDHLCFTFTACPDAVPHSQRLSVYLVEALEDAEKALLS
ncbi:wax ester/triacylglycerol synthase family O-acyltransferase [Mycobacterium sp. HM-7]